MGWGSGSCRRIIEDGYGLVQLAVVVVVVVVVV
jgi:hypothetical protein